jgi:hypothetical protein
VIRSFLDAIRIEQAAAPFDTVQLRVFYPAVFDPQNPAHLATGVLPADPSHSPMPVLVFLQGVNIPAFCYHGLACALAEHGIAVVLAEWMAQNLKGRTSFSPGLDLRALTPETLGSRPSASALAPILNRAKGYASEGVLAGMIDPARTILGGHSAGGAMALLNARRDWFPGVIGAFGICSNLLATLTLGGWPRGQLAPLPADVPMLLVAATDDGVAAHHNHEFGIPGEDGVAVIRRTFAEAVTRTRGDSHLVIVDGANHHSVCEPVDHTLGRTFLDSPERGDHALLRTAIEGCVAKFARAIITGDAQLVHKDMNPAWPVTWETK